MLAFLDKRGFLFLCRQNQYAQIKLAFWKVPLAANGLSLAAQPQCLFGPIPIGEDYIVNNREDVAELVLMTGPGKCLLLVIFHTRC